MTPEAFVDIFQEALYMVLIMVCAIVIPGLLIGLVVAVFQAATSINEQTLSFLPRLIVTLLALMFFGHMMTRMLMDYFFRIVDQIPQLLY
ncbi:flagellar biosynthesis protein FliQ [Photobacterium phosphoreum]|jgi:flagellar biosynthetic protein FliQ|uniref:Flagellar biosynthetic protein FliQ n=3 Tax=Photobacterium TaxID=657 RepID=A0A1A6TY80_9GAMM|nr:MULTISPECIES: flagellar biosynthesis protein FliQ [Photobacterium]KJF88496.1 flagellar biosynthesis protein FliQ [Photobacterium phosphoreum]MCD9470582.1 flagellar biosynthetic protein FliQ [Photobacterium phosphoreum]MCD9473298.1 flagellar biosynthesis protein FliQ [Photobacterium phosphoreum]MCD9478176.1 flagellar biosynthesis protein FliQ [Photobacterium phosphoreum]MCD9482398.1 flagellar biosynthesis protein FliQ [Photobacterium phosphoreum]